MSTDVALPGNPELSRLAVWAEEARATHQIAISLAGTSFVPRSMQGRPDEVTGCILAGRELGMDPMAALRNIDIIDGTPSIRAVGLRGIVLNKGHKVWVEESTATRAVVCGQRRGEQTLQRSIWTMDRARTANLAQKKNWQLHPQAMLVARATAEVCRLIAADAIVGMPYITEEIEDERGGAPVTDLAPFGVAPQRKRTVKRREKPEAPEMELPPPPAGDESAAPAAASGLSPSQLAALHASLNGIGVRERGLRLNLLSQIAGRVVASSAELTAEEFTAVMAELSARADARTRAGQIGIEDPEAEADGEEEE